MTAEPMPETTAGQMLLDLVLTAATNQPWYDDFAELLFLEPGWLTSGPNAVASGDAIAPEALLVAHHILTYCQERNWVLPRIYPTEEGGTSLEWGTKGWVAGAEITIAPADDARSVVELDLWDVSDDAFAFIDGADMPTTEDFLARVATRKN